MLRRAALPALVAGALLAGAGNAEASGAWISSGTLTPVEQRVAVAVGPTRTTLWTSLRFDAAAGPVAIVVPAAPGSSLDLSSDAWLEALEEATAPRVFPPLDQSAYCPGTSGSPNVFELDGQISHTQSLASQDVAVLGDLGALSTWAAGANLTIPAYVVEALSKLSGVSFVACRFAAPPGTSVTPTIRISTPSATPPAPAMLPLALVRAGGSDLKVTAWLIGQGAADLGGGVQVLVDGSQLAWNASTQTSNYTALRAGVLAVGPDAFLVETAGHAPLSDNVSIAQGTSSIDSVVTTFFERSAAYGTGAFDASACITTATPLLGSTEVVADACPRAALGVVAPAATCTESPGAGQVDPASLRCGSGADDLALALSGLAPASAWVTRQSMLIPAERNGIDATLSFASAMTMSPVLTAQSVDTTGCTDGGTGSSGTSSGTTSGSMSSGSTGTSSGYTGNGDGFGVLVDTSDDVVDSLSDASCDCAGTSSTSSPDTTTTDSCSSSDSSSSSSSCSGDSGSDSSGSSSSCSGSSGSDSSGSSSSCSSGSSSSSDSCSGSSGSSGADCSGGGGGNFNCTTAGPHRVRAPKLSILLMAALAVAAPLRRRGRRRRG